MYFLAFEVGLPLIENYLGKIPRSDRFGIVLNT
jgi:hypothetical protein